MRGLYIHIPFCEHKCIYCDFYSIEQTDGVDSFVDALTREIELVSARHPGRLRFSSVFFGGGTPSLLTPRQLERITNELFRRFDVDAGAEFTLEANPGTVTFESLQAYRQSGVNRISFGIQSFHEKELRFLERIHSAEDSVEAVRTARRAGFSNINIDIIFSVPGQTPEMLRQTIDRVVGLEPEHISAYSLTFEPGTPLHGMLQRRQISPLPEEEDARLFELTVEALADAGYEQYEVSNYARPGKECLHNRIYWSHNEYLGFGPSAHSFYEGKRYWNVRSVRRYAELIAEGSIPVGGAERLTDDQLAEETIFLGLRAQGLDLDRLKSLFQYDLIGIKTKELEGFVRDRLVEIEGRWLRVTKRGRIFTDLIARDLI